MATADTVAPKGPQPAERRVTDLPPAKHGDPAENLAPNESVLNVKVGSEAAIESGIGPVLPLSTGGDATTVRNKDLLERDKKEREKRGPVAGTHSVSINFEGPMMVEVDGREAEMKSGSFVGDFVESIKVRVLTEKEAIEHFPTVSGAERRTGALRKEPTQPVGAGIATSRGRVQ